MSKKVPGVLDFRALALLAAELHKPTDPASLAREARQLIGLGLSIPDAAQALDMTPRALADLLNSPDTPEDSTGAHD